MRISVPGDSTRTLSTWPSLMQPAEIMPTTAALLHNNALAHRVHPTHMHVLKGVSIKWNTHKEVCKKVH